MRSTIVCVFLAVALAACGKNGGKSADAACVGGSACGQPCALGNSLGVGKYCSAGSGQCNKNMSSFILCTVDYDSTAPAFCTGPCTTDSECGEDAYCDGSGSTGPKGCVPAACGGTPNPPADAGTGG